jgi:uncharacterized protein
MARAYSRWSLPFPAVIEQHTQRRFTYWDFVIVLVAGFGVSLLASAVAIFVGAMNGSIQIPTSGAFSIDEITSYLARLTVWVALPGQILGELLALAWVSHRHGTGRFSTDFGLVIRSRDAWFLLVGGALLIGLGLIFMPLGRMLGIDQSPQDIVQMLSGVSDGASRIVAFAGIVLLGPLAEELWFRGLLLRTLLQRNSQTRAVLIQAFWFAIIHASGTTGVGILVVIPELFLVGSFLGYLAVRSGSLSRSFFTHAGFNLITTLLLFYAPSLNI